jgi:ribosome-associated protein YbcJ (S4-like RNA binding protein)
MVENGLVKVDGEIESRKRRKVKKGMRVEIEGEETIEVV